VEAAGLPRAPALGLSDLALAVPNPFLNLLSLVLVGLVLGRGVMPISVPNVVQCFTSLPLHLSVSLKGRVKLKI
jgi:hypothetical protein